MKDTIVLYILVKRCLSRNCIILLTQPMQQISNFDHPKLSRVNEKLVYGLNTY